MTSFIGVGVCISRECDIVIAVVGIVVVSYRCVYYLECRIVCSPVTLVPLYDHALAIVTGIAHRKCMLRSAILQVPAPALVVNNKPFAAARLMLSCGVRLSDCPSVTFVYSVDTNKRIFNFFSPPGSHTILVFPYQTLWQYFDGTPPPNWGKNRDFRPISGFGMDHCWTVACCQRFDGGI